MLQILGSEIGSFNGSLLGLGKDGGGRSLLRRSAGARGGAHDKSGYSVMIATRISNTILEAYRIHFRLPKDKRGVEYNIGKAYVP